ncbi:hypothetical protein [Burkholderia plantarii]|uniref:hypothetical protein n=1 Tax=Burkholderia plantarii TaxID=41899 RepID=UPI0014954D20|nr:hypothetical protein [Burkholderia plantarii]
MYEADNEAAKALIKAAFSPIMKGRAVDLKRYEECPLSAPGEHAGAIRRSGNKY